MFEEKIETYELKNESIKMTVVNIGASIVSLEVKDRLGKWTDVVLGFSNLEDYQVDNDVCFGSVIGRNANRIKNGTFKLNNRTYQLEKNNGENNLHSGSNGVHLKKWKLEEITSSSLKLKIISSEEEQGFPGKMLMMVEYLLSENSLVINYSGTSTKDSLFNPTNHTYFNLSGHGGGTVVNHCLKLPSHNFMPIGEDSVPLGQRQDVKGTSMDFLVATKLIDGLNLSDEQLKRGNGYDHHFVLDDTDEQVELYSNETGIRLSLTTNMPGVQLYTGNFIQNKKGKDGVIYQKRSGVCLETQFCPNAINNPFEKSPIIEKDQEIVYETKWRFDLKY